MARLTLLLIASLALLVALAGCGNHTDEPRTEGETEGAYLELGELYYQIQLSRQLNPNLRSDEDLLTGVPEFQQDLGDDEAWFAVFIRVSNETKEAHLSADDFEITDTQENVFRPIALDESNVYRYDAEMLEPGGVIPAQGSGGDVGARGALLLFKIPFESFQFRPLEFRIKPPTGPEGHVNLDL